MTALQATRNELRRIAFGAAIALLAASSAAGAPRALLIGLDYRGGSRVEPELHGIGLDIEMMRQLARDLGIPDIRELWNEDATLGGIREALRGLGSGVSRDDLVLVYFSGHGTRVPDTGDEEDDGWDEVLVPYDAEPARGTVRNVLKDDELGALLARIPSRFVLVVIDACNSGTAAKSVGATPKAYVYDGYGAPGGSVAPAESEDGFVSAPAGIATNFVGIMAAQDDEKANATARGSVLTKSLHEAFVGLKARGAVSVQDLFDSTERLVREEIERSPAYFPQRPNLFAIDKDLVLERLPLGGAAGDPPGLAPAGDDPLIEEWRSIAESVPRQVEFAVSRQVFRPHPEPQLGNSDSCDAARYGEHLMSIEVVAPADGYLNLVDAPEGEEAPIVMFPNEHQPDNRVRQGQVVTVPAHGQGWCLPARLAPGKRSEWNLVVALFSRRDLNYFRDGAGRLVGPLRALPPNARPFLPTGAPAFQAAGSQLLLIEGDRGPM